jgi:predicted outer membrane repeat protein
MIGTRFNHAVRARLRRCRAAGGAGGSSSAGSANERDRGFAFIFVLMVTTVIMTAVAATLSVTTPNIINARTDQNSQKAYAAAQAGIQDVIAYLQSTSDCQSQTRVCTEALGASSSALHRTQLAVSGETFSWTTNSALTSDNYVRVHSTGSSGGVSRSLTADLSLSNSIFNYQYYTDYESQAPSYLYGYYPSRTIALTSAATYGKINAYNTSGHTVSVTAPTTVQWNGPATSGTNPNPASMCGQHWYSDGTGSPGRYSYSPQSVWGEDGSLNSNALTRLSSCDVVFTTGMTFDGQIYTRDALDISDATVGGAGPNFEQPVYTLWGYTGKTTPSNSAPFYRVDPNAGGNLSVAAYKPAVATTDLQLPADIGTTGLPANACVYVGPTRVKLNGDGTATVTSPQTTTANAASDASCYPSGSLAGGIVNFTLNYSTAGGGAIYVKNDGSAPSSGWPGTGLTSQVTPSASNTAFYLNNTGGGATSPDQANSSSAVTTSCSSTVKYAATASWPCAWTNVATTTDGGSTLGWTAYGSATKCNSGSLAATDRELFECEYSHTSGATTPSPSNNYATLRSAVQTQLATGSCLSGSGSTQASCLSTIVDNALQTANTGQHAYNYASPASGDHRYLVTATTVGSTASGTPQSVGSAPTVPMSGDSLFSSSATAAQETATKTPITLTVSRQTWQCSLLNLLGICIGTWGWGSSTPQFSLTSTQATWAITTAASGASYFPSNSDVTQYSRGTSGANGTNGPGDLYVQGTNSGKLSLIAQNDVVITGDITDASSDTTHDAVDIVAEQNVRNYHPVSCADETAADINSTSAGSCPNDITGLYRGVLETNGVLWSSHPAMQYTNMTASSTRRVDAAIFALSGSFLTDNYNRGNALGTLTVNGALYQSHRGANGVQWEFLTTDTQRATSGYSLQFHYVDLQNSQLPYAPPATGGNDDRAWNIVSISAGGS